MNGRWFGDRVTASQSVTVAPGVWSDWITVNTPTTPRDVVGVSWNSGIASGVRRLQFAVGDAGSEVLVGPELRDSVNGVSSLTLRTCPYPLLTTVPGVRLSARWTADSSATTTLNLVVFYVPVSRP